jgi:flagellar hook-length control protein FliK
MSDMTTTSPIQLNTASGVNPRNGNAGNGNGGSDNGQFGALLAGEMQRSSAALALASMPAPASAPAPAPAPTPKQEAKPAEADKPAQPDDTAPQQAGQPADKPDAADAKDDTTAKADDKQDDDDGKARAGDPASAMLALMANLQKPATDNGKTAAAQAFDALAGKGKRTDATQLAALQAAMKSVSKETGVDTAGAKTFSATSIKNPALAAAGADLGADKAAAATKDLGAALGTVKAEASPHLDAADFTLQQARDAALLAQKEQAPTAVATAAQLQPAALEAAQAAAAASEELTARVGTDAWNDQVGQKVVYMVGGEDQTASLTLNPPDLGPLQVVLSVSNGQADVTFSSNQLEVRQALENALPRLQEMMSESGIALGNATVNAGMSNGGQAQQDQAMASSGFGRGGNNGRGHGGNDAGTVVGEATVRPATRTAVIGDRGMVDTFA